MVSFLDSKHYDLHVSSSVHTSGGIHQSIAMERGSRSSSVVTHAPLRQNELLTMGSSRPGHTRQNEYFASGS
jgi:hypothetical protein